MVEGWPSEVCQGCGGSGYRRFVQMYTKCSRCDDEPPFKSTDETCIQSGATFFRPPGWPVTAKDRKTRKYLCTNGHEMWFEETDEPCDLCQESDGSDGCVVCGGLLEGGSIGRGAVQWCFDCMPADGLTDADIQRVRLRYKQRSQVER